MEVAEARAKLVDHSGTGPSAALTLTVPKRHVEAALAEQEPVDLVLQFTRTADGDAAAESGQIAVAWERDELEDLLGRSADDSITIVFDEEELRRMLDPEFEAHGMRGALAVLAVAVAAGGAASAASAQPAEYTGIGGTGTIEQVRSTATTPVPGAQIEAVRAAAAAHSASLASASAIESVRSAEPLAAADTTSLASASAIESVRSAEPIAAPDTGVLASSRDRGCSFGGAAGCARTRRRWLRPRRSSRSAPRSRWLRLTPACSRRRGSRQFVRRSRWRRPTRRRWLRPRRSSRSAPRSRSRRPTPACWQSSGIEAVRAAEPLAASDTGVLASSSAIEGVRSAEAAASRAAAGHGRRHRDLDAEPGDHRRAARRVRAADHRGGLRRPQQAARAPAAVAGITREAAAPPSALRPLG